VGNETTLRELIDAGLEYADMTGSSFPNDVWLKKWANDGLTRVHNILAGAGYFRSKQSYTVVAGTEEYALPTDFYKCGHVWRLSSGRRYPVRPFTLAELSGYRSNGPTSGASCEMWYVPQHKKLRNDADIVSVALPEGWDDYVSLHIAIRLLIKEESDPSALMGERAAAEKAIIDYCEPRDVGMSGMVEDVYNRWGKGVLDDEERALFYQCLGNKLLLVEFGYQGV